MKRRDLVAAGAAMTTIGFPAIVRAQDKRFAGVTLRMNGYGGEPDRLLMETVAQPLERKTGAKLVLTPGTAISALAKVMAAPDNPSFDVLMLDSPVVPEMIKAGVAKPVTRSEFKGIEKALPGMREFGEYGVPIVVGHSVLVYNANRVKIPLRSYADFARPDLKDRLALFSMDTGVGVWLLLALANANGGSVDNVAPGFAALAKMKPNVLTITNSSINVLQLLEREEIWATCFYDGRAVTFKKEGKPIELVEPTEGTYPSVTYFHPVKNSKNADAVHALIEEALTGEYSAAMAGSLGYRPALDVKLPADVAARLFKPKNLKSVDWAKVVAHRSGWINQFNREFK